MEREKRDGVDPEFNQVIPWVGFTLWSFLVFLLVVLL